MALSSDGADAVRVLVVDDNAVNRQVAVGLLKRMDIDSDTAEDGLAALEALRSRRYSLVLMDLQMPGLDGIEATRQLRTGGAGVLDTQVPVVALTANVVAEARLQCMAAGFNDFLTKPLSARMLAESLKRLLPVVSSGEGSAAATAGPIGPQRGGGDGGSVLDRDGLLERSMDDPELARAVLEAFIEESGELSAALSRALREADLQASCAAAHSLRGAAGNSGAVRVREVANDIEKCARAADYDRGIARLGELAAQLDRFRERAFAELNAPGLRQSGTA